MSHMTFSLRKMHKTLVPSADGIWQEILSSLVFAGNSSEGDLERLHHIPSDGKAQKLKRKVFAKSAAFAIKLVGTGRIFIFFLLSCNKPYDDPMT